MKLYEILNEKYLGRKFKLIKDGIEGGWIREVAINNSGKYGYILDDGIWVFTEEHLLKEIKLIETDVEKYKKLIKNPVKVNDSEILEDCYIEVLANYKDYSLFKRCDDVLCIKSIEGDNDIRISITFKDFDKIVEYVQKLKQIKR